MGTVSRVHTFSSGAVLTAAQLNNEFDNLLTSSAVNGGLDATNLGVTAGVVSASKALVVDSSRDLDDSSASNQVNNLSISGTLKLADNKALSLGSNDDITIQYDETTNDALEIAAAVEGAALAIVLKADQGDDAGDEWKIGVADGGALTFGNDKASAGTYVTGLTLTPHATTTSWVTAIAGQATIGSTLAVSSDVTIYEDANNADTSLSIGTSATEALFVQALNGTSNKTLEELRFTTKTASSTADHGKVSFYIDEAEIATIDDGGIDLASGKAFTVAGSALSSGDFSGPGSSTDNAVVRFDGTGGKTGQNSGLIVDDSNNVSGANSITMADGKEIIFGSNDDIKVEYDEAGADALLIQASVDDAPVAIVLSADASADAGDDWKINAANGGTLTFGNDIASAGTFVTGLTLTPHATTASWSMDFEGDVDIGGDTLSFNGAATVDTSGNNNLTLSAGTATLGVTAGDVTIYDDNNNADTSLSIGTSATEALFIQALNGGSNKTLEELRFTTKTASGTGDHGKMTFYVDEAEIATIDDGGIDIASGKTFTIDGTAVGGLYNAWSVKTSGYTAVSGDQLIGNHASSAFTITLPSSPSAGDTVTIKNVGAAVITVGRNSEKINSEAADGTLFQNSAVQCVYVDSTIGWTTL
tara:strand:- start:199 stop:2139 length:1941 start_codon:yes stop_codon:yes gene_type:complete